MLLKNNTNKILKFFFASPSKKFQLRELARVSRISTTGVKAALSELLADKIITKNRDKYEFYEANRNCEVYKFFKKFYNAKMLFDIGIVDHLEKEFNHPEVIMLFGSASRGEDAEKSDVDIFVLTPVDKELDLKKFNEKLNREVKLIVMNKEEFEKAKEKSPELINSITNGIVLRGFLEVV